VRRCLSAGLHRNGPKTNALPMDEEKGFFWIITCGSEN